MFNWAKVRESETSCAGWSARLEKYIAADGNSAADSTFDAHLRSCPECRQALEDGLLARQLMRQVAQPVNDYQSSRLVARVMASINEEVTRRAAESIWKPLELLASKFAMVAAMILLLLGAYLVKSTPAMSTPPRTSQAAVGGAMIPESPRPPSSPDEIVMSLTASAEER